MKYETVVYEIIKWMLVSVISYDPSSGLNMEYKYVNMYLPNL